MKIKLSIIFLLPVLLCFSSVFAQEIVVVIDSVMIDTGTGVTPDQPMIDALKAKGYTVTTVATTAISAESEAFIDTLNSANVVIMGRSISSSTTDGDDKPVWNGIKAPLLVTSPWCVRLQRLGWFNSGSALHVSDDDTPEAIVNVPGDTVFADVTLTDGKMPWVTNDVVPFYDVIVIKDAGNSTALAMSDIDSVILFARFDPGIYFFNGSGDSAAGYRTYMGNGADGGADGPWDYFNYTDEAKTVFINEVAHLAKLGGYIPPVAIDEGNGTLPIGYALGQNYPNPFNPNTTIEFVIPVKERVKLEVFNLLGERVYEFMDEFMPAGRHKISLDLRNLSSGLYLYKLTSGKYSNSKKMLLLK